VTPLPRGRGWAALAVVLSVGFVLLAHASLLQRLPARVGALVSLVPLLVIFAWLARRSRRRAAALLGAGVAIAAGILFWDELLANYPSLFFAEHAGTNLALAILFGRTLAPGHEPLVARFARIVHGTIPPEVERYARRVTIAWTIFFVTLFVLSCLLYLGGWLAAWSSLANIATPVLVCAMFLVEYAVRVRALPHWEQVGILGGVRAFARHMGGSPAEARR
jgi:uncharacterized membrane protein